VVASGIAYMGAMAERLSMRKVREVLRLKFECGRSHAEIATSVSIGETTVGEYLARARRAGLSWETCAELSEVEVERRLFGKRAGRAPAARVPIDFEWVHRELSRPGVTLQTLWIEYREGAAGQDALEPYAYSRFCDRYAAWKSQLGTVMRQVHHAGEKMFIDYSGRKLSITDAHTGEVTEVELFVAVLGASNYTYAEATRSQKLADFVGSTIRALEYFGGVPKILVPDQLRSAVSGPDRYEPDINPTYLEMAQHYGTTVIPARPRKPKDKSKVEGAVLIAQRWIVATLRNRTFFSLGELNAAIAERLADLNARPFQKLEGCRRSAFEQLDRPALGPLPARRYELAEWKHAKVNIDYCISFDHRLYSVPYVLCGQQVEIRATISTVEILHRGQRVASHLRCFGPKGAATIAEEHRPQNHRQYGKWPPERIIAWAETVGPNLAELARSVMHRRIHPELAYRTCLGILRLAKHYGAQRTDAACARALGIGSPTARSVGAILKNGLDRMPPVEPPTRAPIDHEHIRGAPYFHPEDNDDPARDHTETRGHEAARDGLDAQREGQLAPDRPALH